VSPLLANIYNESVPEVWRLTGRGEAFRHTSSRMPMTSSPQSRMCGRGPGVDEGGDDAGSG